MTIVSFPTELIRKILRKLDATPRFSVYLEALARCVQKQRDSAALIDWWDRNNGKVECQNAELDFIWFLNNITVTCCRPASTTTA